MGHCPQRWVLQAHMKSVNSVAFSPKDPSRVIAASSDGTISVWDIDRLELLYRMEGHIGSVTQVGDSAGTNWKRLRQVRTDR